MLGAGLIQADAGGRFQLGKVNGRDCLIDPDGKPFLSLGVNHIYKGSHTGATIPEATARQNHCAGCYQASRQCI